MEIFNRYIYIYISKCRFINIELDAKCNNNDCNNEAKSDNSALTLSARSCWRQRRTDSDGDGGNSSGGGGH